LNEKEMLKKFGSELRAYSYDIQNVGTLGPWKGLLQGKATVSAEFKGDTLQFSAVESLEGEVTGLAEEVKSLQATVKEQEKTIKAQKKTIESLEKQKTKKTMKRAIEIDSTDEWNPLDTPEKSTIKPTKVEK